MRDQRESGEIMKVTIIGTGYVGLSTGIILAYLGHQVTGLDVVEEKVQGLREGKLPIYEPGLEELFQLAKQNLSWTTDYTTAIPSADVIFVAVGTPPTPSGAPDLRYLEAAATSIAQNLDGHFQVIVNKSTVPVGSAHWVSSIIAENINPEKRNHYSVVSNPEFLREGTAITDNLYPDRIVVGSSDPRATEMIRELYRPILEQDFTAPALAPRPDNYRLPPLVTTDLPSAEMIKYAANAFLALKISFANEVAGLCEHVGADVTEVMRGIGYDQRIGPRFLQAGAGWGGSCFGKDTSALISTGRDYGYDMPILKAAIDVNQRARFDVVTKLQRHLKLLKGRTVTILGLAFKPGTDDLRDAPAYDIAKRVMELGGKVKVHDPIAMERAKREWASLNLCYCDSVEDAVQGADAVLLMTEWNEYRALPWGRMKELVNQRLIIDARNLYDPKLVSTNEFQYQGIGR